MDSDRSNELMHPSENLAHAFQNINDISFFVNNLNGIFATTNQAFLRMINVASLADMVGKTDLDFVPVKLARA